MVVYRVSFVGPDFTEGARAALAMAGAVEEGTEVGPAGPCRHCVVLHAGTDQQAIAAAQGALETHGAFREYSAAPFPSE